MRPIPIITAILVTAFLFILVIEREALLAFAAGDASETASSTGSTAAVASNTDGDGAQADEATRAVGVIAIHSSAQAIDSAVILRGETRAAREVQVRAETSARVKTEPLRKGAFVEAGQVMCELEPGTREASLTEARARLEEANAKVPESKARVTEAEARLKEALINENAARKLNDSGYASETRVASADAAVEAARAGVEASKSGLRTASAGIESAEAGVAAAEREIDRLKIAAPFAGILETDSAELGSLLQPGSLCATIVQLDPIKVVGFVPETEVNRVAIGALAGARLATGEEVIGQVKFVSRSADPITRTFLVEIDVPNQDLRIRDGQTAEIAISSDGKAAHLIPQSALTLNDEGTLGVRLVTDSNLVRFLGISLIRDTAQGIWVSGLPEQADVIIVGQEYVIEGARVVPSFQELSE